METTNAAVLEVEPTPSEPKSLLKNPSPPAPLPTTEAAVPEPGRGESTRIGNPFSDEATVRRTPFYLDSQSQPLFSWLHRRGEQVTLDHAVLICPPIGYEQLHSHRTLRHLADRIASVGIPALRFDWHGTGDSSGDDEDSGRVAAWQENIRSAVRWLREELGCRQISLVGLRIGGTLAASVVSEMEIDNLVLWSPVTKGRVYVREMKAINLTAETIPEAEPATDGSIEAGGFVLTPETAADLSPLDLLQCRPKCQRVLLVSRNDLPDDNRLSDHWSASGLCVEQIAVPGYVEMMAEPHHGQVAETAIREIAQWLTQHLAADAALESAKWAARLDLPNVDVSLRDTNRSRHGVSGLLSTAGRPSDTQPALPDSVLMSPAVRDCREAGHSPLRESAMRISSQPDLFGIACEPTGGDADDSMSQDLPLVVLLNAGSSSRVGPGRLNVLLARLLAARGFRSFRFDLCGLGDSLTMDSTQESVTYPATAFRDVELVLSELQRRFGSRRIVLMGLCSGAYTAFQSAAQISNPALVESVLINPLTFFWRDGMSLENSTSRQLVSIHYYLGAALEPRKWLKLLTGRSQIGVAGAIRIVLRKLGLLKLRQPASTSKSSATPSSSGPGHPRVQDLPGDLDRVVGWRRNLALFFATTDPGYSILTFQAQRKVRQLSRSGRLSLTFLPGADHTFSLRSARESLGRAIGEHLAHRYR